MTKQRLWQLKQKALGRCTQCGRPRDDYAERCAPCRRESTNRERENYHARKLRNARQGRNAKGKMVRAPAGHDSECRP
jgi:predicted amidophosphoribosyltransferase